MGEEIGHRPQEGRKTAHRYTLAFCIPVYRAEKYIERMILSIAAQKVDFPMEVILAIDPRDEADYATKAHYLLDGTGIRLIVKKCGKGRGMSCGAARNEAFAACDADYVWFVDADDWLCREDAARYMVAAISENEGDVLVADYESSAHNFNPLITVWTKIFSYDAAKKFPFPDSSDQEDKAQAQMLFSEGSKKEKTRILQSRVAVYHYNWPRAGSLTNGKVLP